MIFKRKLPPYFILAIVATFLVSFFSSGFHHFDEHFQILEFLNFKLGLSSSKDLPWEYHHQLRPFTQVGMFYILTKIVGIFNPSPFVLAYIFRLTSALLGLLSLFMMLPILKEWARSGKRGEYLLKLTLFSWFTPYIFARTSSESMGISFFLIGLSFYLRKNKGWPAAIFFSLSYLVRTQMAICVALIWFWGLFIGKKKVSEQLFFVLVVAAFVGLGVVVDYWGYGEWTFVPWNYFNVNLIEDAVSKFGVDPWWYYFRLLFNRGIPPISLFLLLGGLAFWIKNIKHPLTWITLPFFLIHSKIGHKELRFIFLIVMVSPIMAGIIYYRYREAILKIKWSKKILNFVISLNLILYVIVLFRPANPAVNFYQFIHQSNIKRIWTEGENPFTMLGLPLNFYKKGSFSVEKVKDIKMVESGEYLFFNRGKQIFEMEKRPECKLIYMSYPRWSLNLNIGNWISRSRVWSLFTCLKQNK